jgi:L-malate glycosyltransferase
LYKFLTIKRRIENVFIFPFILIGRIVAYFLPTKNQYRIYFFFSFYHIGGAEKVHAQIAKATGGHDCVIYFTKKSHNNLFLEEFKNPGCTIKDISKYTDNKWLYFLNLIYRGIISGHINRQKNKPVIFNGQCNFGYKISPWIKTGVRQIELIHSLNTFSYIRIPFLPFITKTVMISKKRINDHQKLYKQTQIPSHFFDRITYISNAIVLPKSSNFSKSSTAFAVLFAGRGGIEKRIHLIAAMGEILRTADRSVQFEMLGDVSDAIDTSKYPYIKFYGNQSDSEMISKIYSDAHVLILTSSTEGFPMVVIEAMAHGCTILATPVGDIPLHIKNNEGGFLFSSVTDEKAIVTEGVKFIQQLKNNRTLFEEISLNNINYAKHNFNIEKFNAAYRKILKEEIN